MSTHTNIRKKAGYLLAGLLLLFICPLSGQAPVANFSIDPNICMGTTYTITDLSTNAPTAWSYTIDDGGFTSATVVTVQNPVVNFAFPFIYTITLECSNASGSSGPASQIVLPNFGPNPTVTPQSQKICASSPPANISIASMFGPFFPLDYQWSNGATTASIAVKPTMTTVYTCVITDTMTGCSAVTTATVEVGEASVNVTAHPPGICAGVNSAITASGSGPEPKTYLWTNGILGAAFSSTLPGMYTVTMVNGVGCTATKTYTLANTCVGIDELSMKDQLVMYPNPSAGELTLKAETALKIEITDLTGKLVFASELNISNDYHANVSGLGEGIYIVRSSNGNSVQQHKLIVNP